MHDCDDSARRTCGKVRRLRSSQLCARALQSYNENMSRDATAAVVAAAVVLV